MPPESTPRPKVRLVNAQHACGRVRVLRDHFRLPRTATRASRNWHNGPLYEALYQDIIGELEVRFASQVDQSFFYNWADPTSLFGTPFPAFAQIAFDPATDRVTVDVNQLIKSLVENAPSDSAAAQSYYDLAFRLVSGLRADPYNYDTTTFANAIFSALAQNDVGIDARCARPHRCSVSAR